MKKTEAKPSPERLHLAKLLGTLQEKTFLAYWTGAIAENPHQSEGQTQTLAELRAARLAFDAAFRVAYDD